jgi:DNA-binding protein Alba
MMTTVVQQKTSHDSQVSKPQVPPSVLLVGKKRTLDYVAPALYRINDTDELVIKATGSLSIVTAVDIAEIVKRDLPNIATQSITVGTEELRIATGELKRMSCIEIHLIKFSPIAVAPQIVDFHVPVEESAASTLVVPIEQITSAAAEVPVVVDEKAKKPRAKSKLPAAKKKSSKKRKKAASA